MATLLDIDTPSFILDREKLAANIGRAQARCRELGVTWRPHLKTHKCLDIARMEIASPEGPATVSTVKEAEVFCAAGITDLIYAVGIAPHKLPRIDRLNRAGASVKIILDSPEAAAAVSDFCRREGAKISALIEVDCDGHRSGLKPGSEMIVETARALTGGARLAGVLTHAGGSYGCRSAEAIERAAENETIGISAAAELLEKNGFSPEIVSVGSTPTLVYAKNARRATEYRSGVGAFFDLVMAGIGVCSTGDIAGSVLVTVIGWQEEKGWIITDGGWLAMSRDRGTADQPRDCGYGLVCDVSGNLIPELIMSGANQEHGIISRIDHGPVSRRDFPIGTRFRILPNHACPTAAAFGSYCVVEGGTEVKAVWQRFNNWI